ncbi:MAG: excinuclease ABC subunit UvrC [Devosia sp.]|uniref:excinuclease ABC subunit UvrC n=1 Tax=Devosia sp. TaxID=1871048 RepID=UPI0033933F22
MTDTKPPAPLPAGPEVIKNFVRTLPSAPGVYRMLDENGEVIYVGKARSLKSRVTNYTRPEGLSVRIQRMIMATVSMEFVRTETEAEALLLEANLIKRLKPRFNVLLRDDKSFPYILIATDHEAPELTKHRGSRRRPGHYFGPFASAVAVSRTIASLQKAFLLRNCSDSFYAARTRPCLQYQIKRCAGPCTREISLEAYGELVEDARLFLTGKSQTVRDHLQTDMASAAENLDFERAALIRDRLSALALVQSQGGDATARNVEEADVFAIHHEGGQFCVQVFFFRAFQNWGNHAFRPKADDSLSDAEVLEAFIGQFYEDRTPPSLVLLSHEMSEHDVLEEALRTRAGQKVRVETPQRGEKRDLVNYALQNAREALGRQLAEGASHRALLEGVAEIFGLEETPRRIEVYDNSHISGTNMVGGMIVAGEEGFSKKHYRTFNIKSDISAGDDFGMMREVLTRRFTRLASESETDAEDEATGMPDWPDVVFIDGGAGQLNAVKEVIAELNLPKEVTFIGIAKGEERDAGREKFFMEGKDAFMLPHRDPVLYYVQRLRDEAHRFAIGTHRARRKKDVVKNPLDEIEGIGPTRKRALLNHFGSAKAVARASLLDLESVPSISKAMAQLVYDHFNRT